MGKWKKVQKIKRKTRPPVGLSAAIAGQFAFTTGDGDYMGNPEDCSGGEEDFKRPASDRKKAGPAVPANIRYRAV